MKTKRMRSTFFSAALAVALVTSAACENKSESGDQGSATAPSGDKKEGAAATGDTKTEDKPAEAEAGPAVDETKLAEAVGVEPGGIEPAEGEAPRAYVSAHSGTVEVRRTGEETFAAAEAEAALHAGDQVRTGDDGSAELTLADETVIELAPTTAVAVGDDQVTADPASSAAVLHGIARFSVSDRAEGEGAFLVYTPSGVVGTTGTVFAVGVAATGDVRVGVETGSVEVAGSAKLNAAVSVKAGKAITIGAASAMPSAVAEFKADDWGDWQDGVEAEADPAKLAEIHVNAVATAEADLGDSYKSLDELTTAVVTVDGQAAEIEASGEAGAYAKIAPTIAVDVEAAYLAGLRTQWLTYKMLSHAYLAGELRVRHPKTAGVVVVKARPRLGRAVLYHKKFQLAAGATLAPMRPAYYVHHPRGRVHAAAVGFEVPAFYAKVKLKPVNVKVVARRARVAVYVPPMKIRRAKRRRVRFAGPAIGWRASVKVKPARYRADGGWYVRAKAPRAKIVAGVKVGVRARPLFKVRARMPRARAKVRFGPKGGMVLRGADGRRVRLRAKGGVRVQGAAGAKIKVGPMGGVKVKGAHGAKVRVGPMGGVKVKGVGGGKVRVGPRGGVNIKGAAGGRVRVGPKGGVRVRDGRKGAVRARDGRKGAVRVRDGRKKNKAKGGVKIKAKGGIKIGN